MPRIRDLGRQDPACPAKWHGTDSAYKYGCRCPHARADKHRRYKAYTYRHRPGVKVDSTGTMRRVRALIRLGWRMQDIGERLDLPWQSVQQLARPETPTVYRTTADAVMALYDEWSMTLGPSKLSRLRAESKGWLPPLAWDDETIDDPTTEPQCGAEATRSRRWYDPVTVQRAVRGEQPPMSVAERAAAVAHLAQVARLTDGGIAARLGITSRSVHRIRTAQHIPAVADHGRRTERAA